MNLESQLKALREEFFYADLIRHKTAAVMIDKLMRMSGLSWEDVSPILEPVRENVLCLLSQPLSHYAAMFFAATLPGDDRWEAEMFRHKGYSFRGLISDDAKALLRREIEALISSSEQPIQRIVELGSWIGRGSTRVFCEMALEQSTPPEIICVDRFDKPPAPDFFRENIKQYGATEIVRMIASDTAPAAADFEDGSVDILYVDAAHDYAGVMADFEAWVPKVRQGGLICGDDCLDRPEAFSDPAVLERLKREDQVILDSPHPGKPGQYRFHPGVVMAVDAFFSGRVKLDPPNPDGTGGSSQWFVRKD